ncbi:hypothetical protein Taro_019073 [Colocasia esculenta]|uniref:Uncharacterized protein n=1 Tax=Colocasia esculenta TaxID=4460 RepID=A0A843UT11_COLES|nr:hypothetical protein [Colocasia esculenta]
MPVWLGSMLKVAVPTAKLSREVLEDKAHRDGRDLTLELFSPPEAGGVALRPMRENDVAAMVESIYSHLLCFLRFDNLVGHGVPAEKRGEEPGSEELLGAVAFNNITRLVLGKRFMGATGRVIDGQGMEFQGHHRRRDEGRQLPLHRRAYPPGSTGSSPSRRRPLLSKAPAATATPRTSWRGTPASASRAAARPSNTSSSTNSSPSRRSTTSATSPSSAFYGKMIAAGMDTTAISVE